MATFYNQATLSYNGNVTSSNITTGEIREVLSATKSAVIPTYTPDSDVVFVVSIINSGNVPFTNITVTDNLGEGEGQENPPLTYTEGSAILYINGIKQPDPTVQTASPLVITGITIPANSNAILIYASKTNRYTPFQAGSSITNTAVISGNGFTDINASETITPDTAPDLAISKSLSPAEVAENGQLTYTFIIQNYGNTVAEDNVIFRDLFNPVLENVSAVFNGTAWAEGTNYTYDQTTGEFVTTEGQITVPPAEFTQDSERAWSVQPGVSTLVITGNIT